MSQGIALQELHDQTEALAWPSPVQWVLGADASRPDVYAEALPFDGIVLLDDSREFKEGERAFILAHERVHIHLGNSIREKLLSPEHLDMIVTYQGLMRERGINRQSLRNMNAITTLNDHYKDDIGNWSVADELSLAGIGKYMRLYFDGIQTGKIRSTYGSNPLDISGLRYPDRGRTYTPISPETDQELFMRAVRTGCAIAELAIERMRDNTGPWGRLHTAEEALANWVAARLLGLSIDKVAEFGRQDNYKIDASRALETRLGQANPSEVLAGITDYATLNALTIDLTL